MPNATINQEFESRMETVVKRIDYGDCWMKKEKDTKVSALQAVLQGDDPEAIQKLYQVVLTDKDIIDFKRHQDPAQVSAKWNIGLKKRKLEEKQEAYVIRYLKILHYYNIPVSADLIVKILKFYYFSIFESTTRPTMSSVVRYMIDHHDSLALDLKKDNLVDNTGQDYHLGDICGKNVYAVGLLKQFSTGKIPTARVKYLANKSL